MDVTKRAEGATRHPIGRRIAVVGTTASGKTTLARHLATAFNLPHIELDALYHGPNWVATPEDLFRARTAEALQADGWIVDGGYSGVRDLTWGQAETLIWLDYRLIVPVRRMVWRTVRRIAGHQVLFNGNRETLRNTFFKRDSLLVWMLQRHGYYRRQYPPLLRQPEYAHLNVIRLRSPRATACWLKGITAA